jgi:hypothetical protein
MRRRILPLVHVPRDRLRDVQERALDRAVFEEKRHFHRFHLLIYSRDSCECESLLTWVIIADTG